MGNNHRNGGASGAKKKPSSWPDRSALCLGSASILYATGLQIAGFTAPAAGRWMILASFLAWVLGCWDWLRETKLVKRALSSKFFGHAAAGLRSKTFSRSSWLRALVWPAISLIFLAVVLRAFGAPRREHWRIAIPDLGIEQRSTEEETSLSELPQLLRQKFSTLAPQVEIVCSGCAGLSDDLRARLGADYLLKIFPRSDAGLVAAEIYDRQGRLRKTLKADLRNDNFEVLKELADGLVAELVSDGIQLDRREQIRFDNTPPRSAEALKLNNEAVLAIRKAAGEAGVKAPEGNAAAPGLGDPARKQLEIARKSLDKALDLEPSFAAAIANRAWLDELAGNNASAFKGYCRASSLAPYFAPFSYQLGRFRLYNKGIGLEADPLPRAIKNLETATRLDPTYWQAFNELGNALLRANQDQEARRALEQAIEWVPSRDRWVVRKNLARAELRLGRPDEARHELEVARRELDAVPLHRTEVEYYLAIAYWRGADRQLACASMAAALRSDPAEALPLPEDTTRELELLKDCGKE